VLETGRSQQGSSLSLVAKATVGLSETARAGIGPWPASRCRRKMLPERPLRILIIDDDRADREIYKRCLQLSPGWKFDFTEAESGEEGLGRAGSAQPDCILLDYNLPDQDGLEVVSRLRATAEGAHCAIVMLTAFGGEELAVKAMKAGV